MRPGAKYAAYIVGAMVIAASAIALDGWSYRHFVLLDVYERDWGRMLRMVGYLPTWIVAAAGAVIADRRIRTWRAAAAAPVAFVLYAATLGGIVDELLKIVIRRERPDAAHGVYVFRPWTDHPWSSAGFGMPSSHTLVAFSAAATRRVACRRASCCRSSRSFRERLVTIPYPHISPDIVRVGPFAIRWYGVMYVVGYVVGVGIARRRVRRGLVPFDKRAIDTLVGYLVIGMLVGARIIYVVVYGRAEYAAHPLDAFAIWQGGLSFHGAILGMLCASLLFARRHRVPFWTVADTLALAGTPGLFFGRIGNFINAELYGRPTHVPWAMVFPTDPLHLPRHPSQLYEAVCEGILVFLILRTLERHAVSRGWYRPGLLAGSFLISYGVLRFLIEFTREPDVQLGFVLGPFSMGQLLCAIMIMGGLLLLGAVYRAAAARS